MLGSGSCRPESVDLIVALALFAASLLAQLPFTQYGVSYYDEGAILAIADAMHAGEEMYTERVTQGPLVTYETVAALFSLFGPSLEAGRIFAAAVFSGCCAAMYLLLRFFTPLGWSLVGAASLFGVKTLGFPLWTIVNYSQVSFFFCTVVLLLELQFFATRRLGWLFAAGVMAGLTFFAKQNLGGFIAVIGGLAMVFDWLVVDGWSRWRVLLRRTGGFVFGGLLPVALIAIVLLAEGRLSAMFYRTVVVMPYLLGPYYHVQFPPLGAWAESAADFGPISFTYFPTALLQFAWDGRMNLYSVDEFARIEWWSKLAFYAPLLVLGASFAGLLSRLWRPGERAAASSLLLLWLFALMCLVTTLYRADWTHLLNVYPAYLLLFFVLVGGGTKRGWLASAVGALVFSVWMGAGWSVGRMILEVHDRRVETPRGVLMASRADASEIEGVLDYLGRQPPDARIAFVRNRPLYYFLTGRKIPLSFDQQMPGIIGAPGDDEIVAAEIDDVDLILYDPSEMPSVAIRFAEYAPHTARAIARSFAVAGRLTPATLELRRLRKVPDTSVVVDLWKRLRDRPVAAVGTTGWAMYRVVTVSPEAAAEVCFSAEHRPGRGEELTFLPLFPPELWRAANPLSNDADGAIFSVRSKLTGGAPRVLYEERSAPGLPGRLRRLPLDELAGQSVELQFCVRRLPGSRADVPLGWGELEIDS